MEDVGGVGEAVLEGAVCVGEGLGGGAEAHGLAEVVAALGAEGAGVAHDAGLDGDALADDEALDAGADGGDDACGLVAEDERGLDGKVAVAPVYVVVNWRSKIGSLSQRDRTGKWDVRSLPQRPVACTAT